MTSADYSHLPKAEFAFPGPLRDKLVAAILDGSKTSTTGILADYELSGDPLPQPGEHSVLVDSADQPVGIIEVTEVKTAPLSDVDLAHVIDEGEGNTSVADWRADHESFWHSDAMREAMGDPNFTVDDSTIVVLERFRLITNLR
ncbi:ASCH domain-containing protein [Stackebrandtia nassauensis]|uniref:ASCH domain-containing protein n=1 Tax=Stackebrandtia nassauensis (strain DSM 44728 / CIP 108903 / NRRL B-16338 / NBRC 102104 / LLR-40K-21) TaxID=446470 RepID=D3PV49_STANL|nr:ASCH domain-containing protein [Stackebrandtia nassauensis]ADD41102.1 protein of unknown function DUF437 [Stackebrandtia nassauensis DSM 44728]